MNPTLLQKIINAALEEDLGFGDLSSNIFANNHYSAGTFSAKAEGTLSGLPVIEKTYGQLSNDVDVQYEKSDGDSVQPGEIIATAKGPTSVLLTGERVILNLIQHLSGIATATKKAVDELQGAKTRVCDTRKTLPGIRMLQKYAVRCGGGFNHRYRLDETVMIKDNHIKAAGSISKAVESVKAQTGLTVKVEVETENREQVVEAVNAGADIIMFDNCSPAEVKELISLVPGNTVTEISGGITVESIRNYRDTGADYISIGSLTHSVKALDITFNLKS